MRFAHLFAIGFVSLSAVHLQAQAPTEEPPKSRGRVVVVTDTMPPIKPAATPVPRPCSTPIIVGTQWPEQAKPAQPVRSDMDISGVRTMKAFVLIKNKIA